MSNSISNSINIIQFAFRIAYWKSLMKWGASTTHRSGSVSKLATSFYVKKHSIDANYLNQLEEEDSHHKGCPFWLSGLVTNHCNKNDSSPSVTMSKDTTQESWSASESTVYMKSTSSQSIQTFESGHVKEENARLFISMSPFIAPHSRLHQLHAILSS